MNVTVVLLPSTVLANVSIPAGQTSIVRNASTPVAIQTGSHPVVTSTGDQEIITPLILT